MSKASGFGRIIRSALFSLLALSSAAFLAACAGSSDDPPADVSTTATIDDYIGAWTDGTTTNIEITRNATVAGAGDFEVSSTDLGPAVGTMLISNGKAALTTTQTMSYSSSDDKLHMAVFTLTRVGANTGSAIGQWAFYTGDVAVITVTLSGSETDGSIAMDYLGTSQAGRYLVSENIVSVYINFGTATMNAAKDKITLTVVGEASPIVFSKGSIQIAG